eukprot:gene11059-7690_t
MASGLHDAVAAQLNRGLVRMASVRQPLSPLRHQKVAARVRTGRGRIFRVGALHRLPLTEKVLLRNRRGYVNAQLNTVAHAPSLYHWLFHRCGIPFEETQQLIKSKGIQVNGIPVHDSSEAEVQLEWDTWQRLGVEVRCACALEGATPNTFVPALQRALHRVYFLQYLHPGISVSSEVSDPKSFVHRLSPHLDASQSIGLNLLRPSGFLNGMRGVGIATNDVSMVRYWNNDALGNFGVFDVRFAAGTPKDVVHECERMTEAALARVREQLPQALLRGSRSPIPCSCKVLAVPPREEDGVMEAALGPSAVQLSRSTRLEIQTPLLPYRLAQALRRCGARLTLVRSGPFFLLEDLVRHPDGLVALSAEELAVLFMFERRLKVNRMILTLRELDTGLKGCVLWTLCIEGFSYRRTSLLVSMSWAEQLAKSKSSPADPETVAPVTKPLVVVAQAQATDDSPLVSHVGGSGGVAVHSSTHLVPEYTKGLLIIDANAIIKGMDNLLSVADVLVTTPQVVAELKDSSARALLERLPYRLHLLEPSKAALEMVVDCAEKTGDFGVLSRTDIRLCALAYDCAAAKSALNPPIRPTAAVREVQSGADVRVMTEAVSESDSDDEEEAEEAGEEVEVDSDEEGWITPANLHQGQHDIDRLAETKAMETFTGGVACVTSDYAMQNVLLHLGVPLVGTNGMCVSELRLWLLRCTACFAVVTDTTRQFCPKCGSGDTLRRVHYVINDKGEKQLFINFKRRLNTRGTIYNLPKPRGGKHGTNRLLVLREDQLAHVIRGTSAAALKAKQAMRSNQHTVDDDLAMFGAPVKQKKRDLAAPRMTSSYHKYNVNEKKKVRAAHRK